MEGIGGYTLLRDPRHNKGLAFSETERDAHYLRRLLPPAIMNQELQEKKLMHMLRRYKVPLQRYMAMMDLQERNERLFYKLLIDNVEELLPIVYTPTVGEACQKRQILEVLKNWPERNIQVIVVTDGDGNSCWEAFTANHNAFELLAKYSSTHLVFNDDIQAGTGIAELIALQMSKQTRTSIEETRKKIWLVDSKGLIVASRKESLQHLQKSRAHDHEPTRILLDAVKAIMLESGVGKTFTKQVVEAMASFNEKPIILALSSPTSQSECTAEEKLTHGVRFPTHSPFDAFKCSSPVYMAPFSLVAYLTRLPFFFWLCAYTDSVRQANNVCIFPGFGLGLIISGAIRVKDDMLLTASEALAAQATEENFEKGLIYPPFSNIRKDLSPHFCKSCC
ncbi:hypothetical protein SAY87_030576 [Trapa incisa]|uniref:Malic enzyme n=1 Tax=Trapa incisa TaxID=236973 RepID=A0AAN7QK27_9MYRT|nr:hypothetical protein SAY87_030576 [Trapa incisa]